MPLTNFEPIAPRLFIVKTHYRIQFLFGLAKKDLAVCNLCTWLERYSRISDDLRVGGHLEESRPANIVTRICGYADCSGRIGRNRSRFGPSD